MRLLEHLYEMKEQTIQASSHAVISRSWSNVFELNFWVTQTCQQIRWSSFPSSANCYQFPPELMLSPSSWFLQQNYISTPSLAKLSCLKLTSQQPTPHSHQRKTEHWKGDKIEKRT